MTIRKTLTAILAAGMILVQPVRAAAAVSASVSQGYPAQQAYMQQQMLPEQYAINPANPRAGARLMAYGLLSNCRISARVGAGGVYMSSQTLSNSIVKKLGLKSVTLQYSPNNATWYDVTTVSNLLGSNTSAYFINDRWFPSTNGAGYYRFKATHIAYNNPLDPQTYLDYSNAVKLYY